MMIARSCLILFTINVVPSNLLKSCEKCPKGHLKWIPGLDEMFCTTPDKSVSPWCEPWLPQPSVHSRPKDQDSLETRGDSADESLERLPSAPACGVAPRYRRGLNLGVVGGRDAGRGRFPWMALLGYRLRNGSLWFECGGSIITTRHVLTAAHCIAKKHAFVVRVGEYDMRVPNRARKDVPVARTVGHPDYVRPVNDIAIIVLGRPLVFSGLVKPICLPTASYGLKSYTNIVAVSAGWGHTETSRQSPVLQAVSLPVMPERACRGFYPGTVTSAHLCAGLELGGRDTCQGDSGGPLMINITSRPVWVQIGVVSFGRKCGMAYSPGVYTRVDRFLPWIERVVAAT